MKNLKNKSREYLLKNFIHKGDFVSETKWKYGYVSEVWDTGIFVTFYEEDLEIHRHCAFPNMSVNDIFMLIFKQKIEYTKKEINLHQVVFLYILFFGLCDVVFSIVMINFLIFLGIFI